MRFSVIIPLYNKAFYVNKAISTVLAQTFPDYELIIVDDGSKDNSAEMAAKAIDGHKHCRLIKQKNQGVSVARNNGVAASQGDYLCFLDADDWWEPTFLDEMACFVADYPDAGIYGTNYTIVNETKRKTRVAQIGIEEGFDKGYINYCRAYAKTMYMPLWTGAVCIPRQIFEEMNGFPKGIKLGEDFLLWIRIALKYKVAFLNKPLSFYNQDVDIANRGVGKLHEPQQHLLWNLDVLSNTEKNNLDYKQLVDNLRVYSLLPYFISKEYHEDAQEELAKVNWDMQPTNAWLKYHQPIALTRIINQFKVTGSKIKTLFRK